MIFIRTTEKGGACFIRTDQMDGETDWKLRLAIRSTQALPSDHVRETWLDMQHIISPLTSSNIIAHIFFCNVYGRFMMFKAPHMLQL